ncbi:MAG: hypothetical protein H3C47_12640 [Candidatus Cloacimonetes bacterium]|nr:hypothetical protein [Candidatus Cloacimonadota bacterium]
MKHASAITIQNLDSLISEIRLFPGLKEKKPGTFYFKSQAFLHFHEHGEQLFADIKMNGDWVRYEVSHSGFYRPLLDAVQVALAPDSK